MNPIRIVSLLGFKGLDRQYSIEGPTLLRGPNGAGKSACLEGIVYALSGRVPSGKKLEVVAGYLPVLNGGLAGVELSDSAGAKIFRGITQDRKGKLSETIDCSDLSAWESSEVVLDVREFLSRSPEKRREFVLALVGGGEAGPNLIATIEAHYAKEIAGQAATAASLRQPQDLGDAGVLAAAWTAPRGLREVIEATLAGARGKSLSEACSALMEAAKQGKLIARKRAQDAEAAADEAATKIRGKDGAGVEAENVKLGIESVEELLADARLVIALHQERRAALQAAIDRLDSATRAREEAKQDLAQIRQPGYKPMEPERPDPKEHEKKIKELDVEYRRIQKLEEEAANLVSDRDNAAKGFARSRASLEEHSKVPISILVKEMALVPDHAHSNVPALRAAVAEVSAGWKMGLEAREGVFLKYERDCADAEALYSDFCDENGSLEQIKGLKEKISENAKKAGDEHRAVEDAYMAEFKAYQETRNKWEKQEDAHAKAAMRHISADAAVGEAKRGCEEAKKAVDETPAPDYDIATLEARAASLRGEYETLHAAAQAVARHAELESQAENLRDVEEAWKAAEKAIAAVRETQIGSSTEGLLVDLADILKRAGREESPYLTLENARGVPIFEMGWVAENKKVPLGSLSSGEAVLFAAALSVAITRRSQGRKVLLVEADPLDTTNIEALLGALLRVGGELDALLVATASEGFVVPAGWHQIKLPEVFA